MGPQASSGFDRHRCILERLPKTISWAVLTLTLPVVFSCKRDDAAATAKDSAARADITKSTKAARFVFAGVPWGSPRDSVRAGYRAFGLVDTAKNDPEDMVFVGSIMGRPATVTVGMLAGGLGMVSVNVHAASDSALKTYREALGIISGKYGPPTTQSDTVWYRGPQLTDPFHDAVLDSAGRAMALWAQLSPDSAVISGLMLNLYNDLSHALDGTPVVITYLSGPYVEAFKRRERSYGKIF